MHEQETQINSSDLAVDLSIGQSVEINNNLLKVHRKGDKIYQVDDENVTMLKEVSSRGLSVDNTEVEVDKVSSGESLYKTFSFDKTLCKEETEKCIAFWRGIVETNLEPIKCSLIDGLKDKTWQKEKKKTKTKRIKAETKTPDKECGEIVETKNNAWFQILQELQKRKLHQTKLMMEERCRFCQYLKGEYESDLFQNESTREIKDLDDWIPKQSKYKFYQGSRSSVGKQKENAKRKSSVDGKTKPSATLAAEELIEEVLNNESLVQTVKKESQRIEHVNAIERKKEEGVYSEWRVNQMVKKCNCELDKCDCNVNPAVVAVEQDLSKSSDTIHRPDVERKSILNSSVKPKGPNNRRISVLVGCSCLGSDCNCHLNIQKVKKDLVDDQTHQQEPQVPFKVNKSSLDATNSLVLIRKRFSSKSGDIEPLK